jgi:hypothetical protein
MYIIADEPYDNVMPAIYYAKDDEARDALMKYICWGTVHKIRESGERCESAGWFTKEGEKILYYTYGGEKYEVC